MDDPAIVDYIERVQFFNAHTHRYEIRHPGHMSLHRYCPLCGKRLPHDQHEAQFQKILTDMGGFK